MNGEQQAEIDKYEHVYRTYPDYRMGGSRKKQAEADLALTNARLSYLDVGCGRGEMLAYAKDVLGFDIVHGTETVRQLYNQPNCEYALATDLPFKDNEYDVVSCLDVLEHLLPADTERALTELSRVARHSLLLTANNKPSKSLGYELHINKRPYAEWDQLIRDTCGGHVQWLNAGIDTISETWLVAYD